MKRRELEDFEEYSDAEIDSMIDTNDEYISVILQEKEESIEKIEKNQAASEKKELSPYFDAASLYQPLTNEEEKKLLTDLALYQTTKKQRIEYYETHNETFPNYEELSKLVNLDIPTLKRIEESREKLINHNLRLVISNAMLFLNRGLTLDDLISFGNVGLVTALDRFDTTKNLKVSTYATIYIRSKMLDAINRAHSLISIPIKIRKRISLINKAAKKLEKELYRQPTNSEIARELNLTAEDVSFALLHITPIKSIDDFVDSTEQTRFVDILGDSNLSPAELSNRLDSLDEIHKILKSLPLKEQRIISLLYGMDGITMTHEELAKHESMTRQKIIAIEKEIITKIRNELGKNHEQLLT